jgi:hypothetical protein
MKITESQKKHYNLNLHLFRRLPDIERELNSVLEDSEDWDLNFGFDNFLHNIAVSVGVRIADLYNPEEEDKYITLRNQVIRFVKNEFYYQIKQMYLRYNGNPLHESKDSGFLRREKSIKELVDIGIDQIAQSGDFCNWTFSDFLEEICWHVSDKAKLINMDKNEKSTIQKWVRNNFSKYIKEVYDYLLNKLECYDYYEEFDNDDF